MIDINLDNKRKKNLVLLFNVLNHFNISDLTANHASVMSSDKKSFYINQHKFLFSEISSKNLIKIETIKPDNNKLIKINRAGYYIHKYLHLSKAKPDYILHTHSENAVAISCLKNGFNTKLNQSSMRFYNAVKYFDYNGMVVDDKEGKKLARLVNSKTRLIILKNHGIIMMASTVEELFHLTFHFEKCASIQLKIINSGEKIVNVNNSVAQKTYNDHNSFGPVGNMSWNAILRTLNLLKKK
jgi:ribulose-5-phosphate 4-epimerase/fuculose-1-phosphate aldolase